MNRLLEEIPRLATDVGAALGALGPAEWAAALFVLAVGGAGIGFVSTLQAMDRRRAHPEPKTTRREWDQAA